MQGLSKCSIRAECGDLTKNRRKMFCDFFLFSLFFVHYKFLVAENVEILCFYIYMYLDSECLSNWFRNFLAGV